MDFTRKCKWEMVQGLNKGKQNETTYHTITNRMYATTKETAP